ncbi:MAG: hypothetical protein D6B25_19605 [Desulfobulbaceae bacterium]|nr:MAG: hypothetical protein D6B25_19605 [Desulfobulbaceae bacterium]
MQDNHVCRHNACRNDIGRNSPGLVTGTMDCDESLDDYVPYELSAQICTLFLTCPNTVTPRGSGSPRHHYPLDTLKKNIFQISSGRASILARSSIPDKLPILTRTVNHGH